MSRHARFTLGIWHRYLKHLTYRVVTINGEAGLAAFDGQRPSGERSLSQTEPARDARS